MPSNASWNIRDASNENSGFTVPIVTITGANYATVTGQITALQNAIIAAILGNVASRQVVAEQVTVNNAIPADPYAQRELKMKVNGVNQVTQEPTFFTIPTPNLTNLTPGTDLFNLGDTEIAALVTAIEALWRGGGVEQINVESIQLVGRNL